MFRYGDVPPSQGKLWHQCPLSGYSFSTTYAPVFAQGIRFFKLKYPKYFLSLVADIKFSGYTFPHFHDFQGIYLRDYVRSGSSSKLGGGTSSYLNKLK